MICFNYGIFYTIRVEFGDSLHSVAHRIKRLRGTKEMLRDAITIGGCCAEGDAADPRESLICRGPFWK